MEKNEFVTKVRQIIKGTDFKLDNVSDSFTGTYTDCRIQANWRSKGENGDIDFNETVTIHVKMFKDGTVKVLFNEKNINNMEIKQPCTDALCKSLEKKLRAYTTLGRATAKFYTNF